jgi:hypothetical protein
MSVMIRASLDTRRQAVALASAMLQDDPGATVGDFLGVIIGAYAQRVGARVAIPPPTVLTGEPRGRRTDLVTALTRDGEWFVSARPGLVKAIDALKERTGLTMADLYRAAVDHLWAEVCGPDAGLWERTRRAEVAGCAAAA